MSRARSLAVFIAQSAAAGLAAAFVIVLMRPELANLTRGGGRPAEPASYARAVAASSPAVVNVYTERQPYEIGNGMRITPRMLGSGVIVSASGLIVTNWHVVAECSGDAEVCGTRQAWRVAEEILIKLEDGRVANAALVGEDPDTELALLKIDLPDLPSIALGRSDDLAVGDVVLAIGNARGLSQTVTMGIVSAVGRSLSQELASFENFIQTDAAINAGNSGGALVNARGELIGINVAVVSDPPDGGSIAEGLGFAIPVNLVRGVIGELIEHGRVIRGYLGVSDPDDLDSSQTRAYGVSGPAVRLLDVSGPAAAAGLVRGDVLTHIDGQRIYNRQQAMSVIAGMPPGASVEITVVRADGSAVTTFTTRAVLEEREPNLN
jgi:S1-C subfamily serine protease